MLTQFKIHIENNFRNLVDGKFIIACSGGLDSMVLTHVCNEAKLDYVIAHCNFHLRGAESDSDENFVRSLADNVNKKIYVTHFDTNDYIVSNKVNLQIAARELRYAWFTELMQETAIKTLVTAHHADDNLETFIINLSRGTGIEGLTGIPEKTDTISRPLLPFSRAQILDYAKVNNLKWVEDRSNSDTKYLRNKIRHDIVPLLKELHPTFLDNFKLTRLHLADSSIILGNHIELLKSRCFEVTDGGFRIAIAELEVLYPQKAYLYALLKAYGFTAWDDIVRLLNGLSGKEIRSKTYRLVRNREYLLLQELKIAETTSYSIQKKDTIIEIPFRMTITSVDQINETNENILYVDEAALKYPLTVRKWEKGDYFYPFGMKGKKKLSKYFKDEKIDAISKEKQWLMCSGSDIVWVVGRRSDRRFSIGENTKNILKLELNK